MSRLYGNLIGFNLCQLKVPQRGVHCHRMDFVSFLGLVFLHIVDSAFSVVTGMSQKEFIVVAILQFLVQFFVVSPEQPESN